MRENGKKGETRRNEKTEEEQLSSGLSARSGGVGLAAAVGRAEERAREKRHERESDGRGRGAHPALETFMGVAIERSHTHTRSERNFARSPKQEREPRVCVM